jgi:DNA polymerase/3'-5' exonuclease PolX
MSNGLKMSLPFARNLAERMVAMLETGCERIEIAGSIRRKKTEVGDVEIVLIPLPLYDLFGEPMYGAGRIEDALIREGFELSKNGDYFKQAHLPNGGVNFDIFLTTPEKWGMIYTIRTGSADFTHWLVTSKQQGGGLPSNMKAADGRIWCNGKAIDTPDEADVFRVIGLDYIAPEKRIDGRWKR